MVQYARKRIKKDMLSNCMKRLTRFFSVLVSVIARGENQSRVEKLKSLGVKVGENCELYSMGIYGDPSRVRIGSHVKIASYVCIITLCPYCYQCDFFVDDGRCNNDVSIGDNSFLGISAIVNPGSVIGRDCIIGAGSVVNGIVQDGTVVFGNPSIILTRTTDYRKRKLATQNRIDTKKIESDVQKRKIICHHFGITQSDGTEK